MLYSTSPQKTNTVNVEIFALYIFSCYLHFSNIREKYEQLENYLYYTTVGNNMKNVHLSPHKIANFPKFVKMYSRKNIYIHSSFHFELPFLIVVFDVVFKRHKMEAMKVGIFLCACFCVLQLAQASGK